MFKKTGLLVLGLALLVSMLFILEAQSEDKGWKKTVTLPSGEVVCDLSGQWDMEFRGRGEMGLMVSRVVDIYEISQQEGSFKGIRLIGNEWNPKGGLAIEGALDKNGISILKWYAQGLEGTYQAKLSKDGNIIEWRDHDFFMELTRK